MFFVAGLERILELVIGCFFIFHGVNGLIHWLPIPPQNPHFERFVQALIDTRFIMPVCKLLQIFAGVLLVAGLWTLLATALLAPMVFVIVGAHLSLNLEKGWRIALLTGVPFFALLYSQGRMWLFLLN